MLQNMQNFLMCGPIHLQMFHCSSAAQGSPHKLNLLFTACLKSCGLWFYYTTRRNFQKELFSKNSYFQLDEMAQIEERAHFWPFHTFREIKTVISWGKLNVWQLRKEKNWYFLEIFWLFKISWLNLENHYIQFKRLQSSLLFKVSSL